MRLAIWYLALLIVVFFILALVGCNNPKLPNAIPHPDFGTQIMLVPEGTKIGEYTAPADGMFLTNQRMTNLVNGLLKSQDLPEKVY